MTDTTDAVDSAPRDEEGLLFQYDVVLCGTGLVQSILASALARAGKSVLHCDAADYYGELDTVWTLPCLQQQPVVGLEAIDILSSATVTQTASTSTERQENDENDAAGIPLSPKGAFDSLQIHSMKSTTTFPIHEGTKVSTPYGLGTYQGRQRVADVDVDVEKKTGTKKDTYISLAVSLTSWKLANGSCPTVYVGALPSFMDTDSDDNNNDDDDDDDNNLNDTILATYLQVHHGIQAVRSVRACQVLQESSYSRSLALDVTPGLLFCAGPSVSGLLTSGVADYLEFKSLEGLLWLESSGTGESSSSSTSTNSNSNRRLERVPCSKNDVFSSALLSPMDKRRLMKFLQLALDYATAEGAKEESDAIAAAAEEGETGREEDVRSLNERHLNQGRSLARPQNKAVSTGDIQLLQQCIAQGMDFETYLREKQRLSPKLCSLVRYALTLESGRPSGSLPPSAQEGMKHLCQHMQSLGRFGSTAFLVPVYGSGELPQAFCRSAAVYGATYLLRRAPLCILTTTESSESEQQKTVQGIVLGGDEEDGLSGMPVPKSKQVNCSHVIAPLESMTMMRQRPSSRRVLRQISILCGKPIRSNPNNTDTAQRHAVILPPNSFGNPDTIHGIIVDEKVNVAPHVPGGCTVIHLTTTVDVKEGNPVDNGGILEQAMDSIVGKDADDVYEIFRVVFSYSLFDADEAPSTVNVNGLHTIHRPRPGLAADPAFEQAKQIFTRICPTVDFLTMSESMDAAVKERLGDTQNEEDDDRMVLESAMGIIDAPTEE
jgi:RAB protein geranylgeranyltransferase component A